MSVQRFSAYHSGDPSRIGLWADTEGHWVTYADHARIVAEAGAAVFAFHPEWTVTGMCEPDCLSCRRLTELITEREKGYEEGKADAEQAHAAALAEAEWDANSQDTHYMRGYTAGRAASGHDADCACTHPLEPRCRHCSCEPAAAPRTLNSDDREPAVGSVVLDDHGRAWQRTPKGWTGAGISHHFGAWRSLWFPVHLIHDGEETP